MESHVEYGYIQNMNTPAFRQLFLPDDPGLIRIIAGFWQVDTGSGNVEDWINKIQVAMQSSTMWEELAANLPSEPKSAFEELRTSGGVRSWSEFSHRFGEIREMGAGRRDRERPQDHPENISEYLYYRGLFGRLFLPDGGILREYVCIPAELLSTASMQPVQTIERYGQPAGKASFKSMQPIPDQILDHCTILLAAIRSGIPMESLSDRAWAAGIPFLGAMLTAAEILDPKGSPHPAATKTFLEEPREQALSFLLSNWLNSRELVELSLIPGLTLEGAWNIDPLRVRNSVLAQIGTCPKSTWWGLNSFLTGIHAHRPDILRESGDYDLLYIRQADGKEWKGFSSWFQVEGRLISFFLAILGWFGLAELGFSEGGASLQAFKLTADFDERIQLKSTPKFPPENGKLSLTSTGQVLVSRRTPRVVHYQVARYCDWGKEEPQGWKYRMTSASLSRAQAKGLQVKVLIPILQANSSAAIPPALLKSLQNWEKFGSQAKLERQVLLRVTHAEIIDALLVGRSASLLGERLNPLTILVRPGREQQVLDELARQGFLGETRLDV